MTREGQISNGFTEMMKGFWGNQDLKVPDFEEPYKQEPCEDCISREKAKQFLYERLDRLNDDELYDIFSRIIDDMYNELPYVTPQPKTGRWILSDDGLCRPICDKCGAHPWKGYIPTVEEVTEVFKYCPNCGAKMVEPQEVRGKEC